MGESKQNKGQIKVNLKQEHVRFQSESAAAESLKLNSQADKVSANHDSADEKAMVISARE